MIYTSQIRRFLLKHPLLVIELGFHLKIDPHAPYGFHTDTTLPTEVYLRKKLRSLDQTLLQALLQSTVRDLQQEIAGLGETVAFDVKHIYGWVKENNERVYVRDRYDKHRRLAGDPECRLGVKKSSNHSSATSTDQAAEKAPSSQEKAPGTHTPKKASKETNEKEEPQPRLPAFPIDMSQVQIKGDLSYLFWLPRSVDGFCRAKMIESEDGSIHLEHCRREIFLWINFCGPGWYLMKGLQIEPLLAHLLQYFTHLVFVGEEFFCC